MVLQGTLSQQALAVAVEPLAAGQRIAVFGDATAGLDAILLEQGARAVTMFDPDVARALGAADEAAPGVTVQPYGEDEPRPVDVAIIADLGLFADPADLVARARRMVGEYGVAVFAAANADHQPGAEPPDSSPAESRAFDYYDLFDLIANEFQTVRMVARLPFYGVALMELGGDEEDAAAGVNVDTRLAEGGRTPEGFVVVASQGGEARLPPYSIVELPSEGDEAPSPPPSDPAAVAALSDAQARAALLARQVEETRARVDGLASQLEEARARAARADALGSELEETRARAAAAQGALQGVRLLEAEVLDRTKRAAALEAMLEESTRAAEGHSLELARLEEGLRERAKAIRVLESEVARRDRMVRDLVGAMEDAGVEPRPGSDAIAPIAAGAPDAVAEANAEALVALRARLDGLALELARREGEAHASTWKIEELERRLAQTADARPPTPDASATRSAALDELDALRQALVQEHDARLRAESGEELGRLRAEIARQAALLGQGGGAEQAGAAGAEGQPEHEVSR